MMVVAPTCEAILQLMRFDELGPDPMPALNTQPIILRPHLLAQKKLHEAWL